MKIVWRDLLKPRYALKVEVIRLPDPEKFGATYVAPCIISVPYKRPLDMPFNTFYNALSSPDTFHFCGSKWALSKLYGIGSVLPHNIKRAKYLEVQDA